MIIVPDKDKVEANLEELRIVSQMMKESKQSLTDLSERRLQLILTLRKQRVTYKKMTEYTGTSYQNIYKIVRDYIPRDHNGNAKKGRPRKEEV